MVAFYNVTVSVRLNVHCFALHTTRTCVDLVGLKFTGGNLFIYFFKSITFEDNIIDSESENRTFQHMSNNTSPLVVGGGDGSQLIDS